MGDSEAQAENSSGFNTPNGSSEKDKGKSLGQALLADPQFLQPVSTAMFRAESHGSDGCSAVSTGELQGTVHAHFVTKGNAGVAEGPEQPSAGRFQNSASVKRHKPECIFLDQSDLTDNVEEADADFRNESYKASTARWQASEELTAFLDTTRKPLSKYDRRQIICEFPRPTVDSVFTPRLDSYLPGLMRGLTGPDNELKDIKDKVVDIFGPLGNAYEHISEWQESPNATVQLSKEEINGLMVIVQRSMQLAGHASSLLSQKCRVAVMTKVNNAYASLGKEEFPGAGKDLFGKGFEARPKEHTETAKAIIDAKRAGSHFFRQNSPGGRSPLSRGGS